MNKQSLFALLFSSWIFGISLICLFPPIPDYHAVEQQESYLSQDTAPEIHQRISSHSILQMDFGVDFQGFIQESSFTSSIKFLLKVDSKRTFQTIPSSFDTRILFKAFFETW